MKSEEVMIDLDGVHKVIGILKALLKAQDEIEAIDDAKYQQDSARAFHDATAGMSDLIDSIVKSHMPTLLSEASDSIALAFGTGKVVDLTQDADDDE